MSVLWGLSLAGCVSTTRPVPDCCYQGPAVTTRLADLDVRSEDDRRLRFSDAFPGFTPHEGPMPRALPFNEVLSQDIIFASLEPLIPIYDANGDGRLEKPEVTVLYAREAAIATGVEVRHFGWDDPIWAVSAPNADIGGLVNWVEERRGRMSKQGQAMFRDLEWTGIDLRARGRQDGADKLELN